MRMIVLGFALLLLPAYGLAAKELDQKSKKPTPHSTKENPCAQYGAGFVQIPNSTTCIKTGAGITVQGGSRW